MNRGSFRHAPWLAWRPLTGRLRTYGWLGTLDAVLHFVRAPRRLLDPVCDRWERRLADGERPVVR